MRRHWVIAAAAVLLFDVAWAAIFRAAPYAAHWTVPLVTVAWVAVGVAIGLVFGLRAKLGVAALAVAGVGLVDATLGWALTWIIGPGQWTRLELTANDTRPVWLGVTLQIVSVVVADACLGLIGALVARLLVRRRLSASRAPAPAPRS